MSVLTFNNTFTPAAVVVKLRRGGGVRGIDFRETFFQNV